MMGVRAPTPKRHSTNSLVSRRIADIRSVVQLEQSNLCSVYLSDGGEDSEKVTVEIKPSRDLFIQDSVCFEIQIPEHYPAEAPQVTCKTDIKKYKEVLEVDSNGSVSIPLLGNGESGWSRIYNLVIVFYGLRLLFKDKMSRWNHVHIVGGGQHGAWGREDSMIGAIQTGPKYRLECFHHGEQGIRRTMEDSWVAATNLVLGEGAGGGGGSAAVALLDGHGGHLCADHAAEVLPGLVIQRLRAGAGWRQALWQAVQDADADFRREYEGADRVGCTCLLLGFDAARSALHAANLGDCRAVLCRGGRAVELTRDTRADRPDEVARVAAAGGFVANGRVNGKLAVSRALGDFMYKMPGGLNNGPRGRPCRVLPGAESPVSCEPEMSEVLLTEADSFVLVACDGLWDVMSSEDAINFVLEKKTEGMGYKQIAEKLVDRAISELDSTDNVSAIIIDILPADGRAAPLNQTLQGGKDSIGSLDSLFGSPDAPPKEDGNPMMRLDSIDSYNENRPNRSSEGSKKEKDVTDLNDDELFEFLLDENNFA